MLLRGPAPLIYLALAPGSVLLSAPMYYLRSRAARPLVPALAVEPQQIDVVLDEISETVDSKKHVVISTPTGAHRRVQAEDLEAGGVFFVIAELAIKYRRGAKYDEELELETRCLSVSGSKIKHIYELKRVCDGEIIAEGSSVLACVSAEGKVRRIPGFMYLAE